MIYDGSIKQLSELEDGGLFYYYRRDRTYLGIASSCSDNRVRIVGFWGDSEYGNRVIRLSNSEKVIALSGKPYLDINFSQKSRITEIDYDVYESAVFLNENGTAYFPFRRDGTHMFISDTGEYLEYVSGDSLSVDGYKIWQDVGAFDNARCAPLLVVSPSEGNETV